MGSSNSYIHDRINKLKQGVEQLEGPTYAPYAWKKLFSDARDLGFLHKSGSVFLFQAIEMSPFMKFTVKHTEEFLGRNYDFVLGFETDGKNDIEIFDEKNNLLDTLLATQLKETSQQNNQGNYIYNFQIPINVMSMPYSKLKITNVINLNVLMLNNKLRKNLAFFKGNCMFFNNDSYYHVYAGGLIMNDEDNNSVRNQLKHEQLVK